ncbi:MAG TPA: RHS repeat-associated core domain-containing protein, partial [Bryobacteraceae bacterium]|nr:RHS repeat-associated core domain-containing protein [Bryobacteraceae bacterium]
MTKSAPEFTGKERDAETGLDYFGARYFSGAQGRFTSTDPTVMTRARIFDPQQWNLYSYVRNNPLAYIDPDGRDLRIIVTNVPVGRSYVNRYTGREMRANPRLQQVRENVSTFRMILSNDTGSTRMTEVTRDTNRNGATSETRGNYGRDSEAPPGTYSGAVRTDVPMGFRVELSNAEQPGSGVITGPNGNRDNIQIHLGPGCSEGCMLLTGGQQGRTEFQGQVEGLLAEDRQNNLGTGITVVVVDRNPQPVRAKLPEKLDLPELEDR